MAGLRVMVVLMCSRICPWACGPYLIVIINKTTFSDIRRVFLPVDVLLRVEGQGQGGRGVHVTRREPATGKAIN